MNSITTTLGTLVAAEPALKRLSDQKLTVKTAYHIAKLLKFVGTHLADYNEQRVAHVKELGAETDGNFTVTKENWPEFDKRMQELFAIEVTIPWKPVTFEQIAAIAISPADILALDTLVQDAPPEPVAPAAA
jgi:hypothetical protein